MPAGQAANLRRYGRPPFGVAVVHGGPGAAGEMAPVARELACTRGVLEPLQTAASLEGQVQELRGILEQNGELPVTLIGFSWGAWLSLIVAARYPALVKKLVLVGSGPFEERYAAGMEAARLRRLAGEEREEAASLLRRLDSAEGVDRDAAFARLGALLSKADSFDVLPEPTEPVDCRLDIYEGVWREAAPLRRSGELLALAARLACPVVAIHGEEDSHPAEGVREPLSAVLKAFRFLLLERCGHRPWIERQARDRFYELLRQALCG